MRILVTVDINTSGNDNPYMFQLLRSLESHKKTSSVQHGTGWLWTEEYQPDVVHIHWPELLRNWHNPTTEEIKSVESALSRLKQKAVVVVTVHNEYPHNRDTPAFRKLYSIVYANADGIIHMGEASRHAVRERYSKELDQTEEIIIPHGNYSCFPNHVSREEARRKFSITQGEAVFLCFGRLRNSREVTMLQKAFGKISIPHKKLLIATSYLPYTSRGDWRRYRLALPLWLSPSIVIKESLIPPNKVQYFFNAADVLIIPRLKVLNSGNLALGFTFGRVVVGPNRGVVGEILQATGNPTFEPNEPSSWGKALEQGYALAENDLGQKNKTYSQMKMNWSNIADRHINFYRHLLSKHKSNLLIKDATHA